ncbi:hypothetical protein LUZ63_008629 [Rhynchospora breviuscula]|uniref:Uncharacterized protein n=1 Tax=Rhynchospora breviuscula TaxID=2022672 RepID=A0A9Q0CUS8_9POAL|nr:hypothetical protein LUZ63_008629 [Rhynchospora breviuscula]
MARISATTQSLKRPSQQFPKASKISKLTHKMKKPSETLKIEAKEKRDWEDAVCSVCMERPHNAVLLLCSSHEKGCRPYMCGTGPRLSNCLTQFKKAYSKGQSQIDYSIPGAGPGKESGEAVELACPLCRGHVKGWTVVVPARKYLNRKKRTCAHDNCSFRGSYKQLRNHIKAVHPAIRTRQVDPVQEQRWQALEREREREDVMSAIQSAMPRSVVFGDYVIDLSSGNNTSDTDSEVGQGRGGNRGLIYLLLRERARYMRMGSEHRGNSNSEHRGAGTEGNNQDNAIDLESDDVESDDWSSDGEVFIPTRRQRGQRRRDGARVRFL